MNRKRCNLFTFMTVALSGCGQGMQCCRSASAIADGANPAFQPPTRRAVFFLFFAIIIGISLPAYTSGESSPPVPVSDPKETPAQKKNIADLIAHVTGLSHQFTDLQRQIDSVSDTFEIHDALVALSEKLEDLSWDITFSKSGGYLSYEQLAYYNKELAWKKLEIEEINKPLSDAIKRFTDWKGEWSSELEQFAGWRAVAEKEDSAVNAADIIDNYEKTVDKAMQLIARQLKPLLETDQQIGTLQVKIHALDLETDKRMAAIRKARFRQKAPSMMSREFYSQFNMALWQTTWQNITTAARFRMAVSDNGSWVLVFIFLAFTILPLLIYISGRQVAEDIKWLVFARRPMATSTVISATLIVSIFINLPPAWLRVIWIVTLVAVLRLARRLLGDERTKRIATQFSALLLVTGLFSIINLPMNLFRLYVFLISAIGLGLCLRHGWPRIGISRSKRFVWAFRLGALLFSCVLVSVFIGYTVFSFFLFNAFLRTIFLTMVAWTLFLVVSSAAELAFHKSPYPIVQRNASEITRWLNPLIIFFFAIFFSATALVIWRVFTTEWEAVLAFMAIGFDMGSKRVTIGLVLTALSVLYVAVLASRVIQAALLQGILQRRNVEKGIQFSIARLVHYAIVTIGFVIALHALGLGMTNLTILGGALGVGIGFGLQAIVNNFASGLILLFERPLKVGDTIQIGDQMGEVCNLGLRATVIKTYDSAEIVVPNSDLITGQLTNWTLGERCVRLKLPVGVAYGSDVARVMGLLMSCANENKRVLKEPAPCVLFLGFGSSSLDFELRLWIGEFTDRRTVQSEVNQVIDLKLRKAGIEIPFPKRDIYLKSVPDAITAKVNSSGGDP